ncbi:MAG: glycosyltransferase [Clostridiaceae bacterium]|nr:glycosyltransferase [Clostridiaceae bacterium]
MNPLVSVCCITYNHEKYIAEAIESFIMQKTDFPIEIIIHDDASTDNTANIIKGYEKKYPDIIKPILQEENQYSQGKSPMRDFVIPFVEGKYIATCEGDDYWTDVEKLQKQVDFMENNKDYTMCFHKVEVVDIYKNPVGRYLGLKKNFSKKISVGDAATGGVVHVSSRLIKADFSKKQRPGWIRNAKHGDYAFALYSAAEGLVFYMNEVMSAHRVGVADSMMTKFGTEFSKEKIIEYYLNRIEILRLADEYYNYSYHHEIKKVNLSSRSIIALLENDYTVSARKIYMEYIKYNGWVGFAKMFVINKLPKTADLLVRLKGFLVKNSRWNRW